MTVGYGIYNGKRWAERQRATYEELAPKAERQVAELRQQLAEGRPLAAGFGVPVPSNPYSMSTVEHDVTLPPAPLAALSVGQSDLYPQTTEVRAWKPVEEVFAQAEPQNPVNLQAGRFDLAFVVVYLFPLLILAGSYNLLSGEREHGTLALLLSQPVSLMRVVVGKVAARALLLTGLLVGFTLLGLLVARVDVASSANLFRLLLWASVVTAYGLFWFALAALVNLRGHDSAQHALLLAGAWLLLVVIVPSFISAASGLLYPVPPRSELIIAYQDAEPDTRRDGQRVLARFYEDHPELRPEATTKEVSEFRRQLLAVYLANLAAVEPLARRYNEMLTRQQTLVSRLRFLSPAVVTQETLNDLSGTGSARYQDFRRQVGAFIQQQRDFFFPRALRSQQLSVADYDSLPLFKYREEAAATLSGRVLSGLAQMLLLLCVCCAVAMRLSRRYSVAA